MKWYVRPNWCKNCDLLINHNPTWFEHHDAHLQERKALYYYVWFSALNVLSGVLGSREPSREHSAEAVIRVTPCKQCTGPASGLPKTPASTLSAEKYRVSEEECARLRESVPYFKPYRYNPKHLCLKLNGYGDNGKRKVCPSCGSTHCTPSVTSYLSNAPARSTRHGNAVTLACALQHCSSDVTR